LGAFVGISLEFRFVDDDDDDDDDDVAVVVIVVIMADGDLEIFSFLLDVVASIIFFIICFLFVNVMIVSELSGVVVDVGSVTTRIGLEVRFVVVVVGDDDDDGT
jgi:hypothetical protein